MGSERKEADLIPLLVSVTFTALLQPCLLPVSVCSQHRDSAAQETATGELHLEAKKSFVQWERNLHICADMGEHTYVYICVLFCCNCCNHH